MTSSQEPSSEQEVAAGSAHKGRVSFNGGRAALHKDVLEERDGTGQSEGLEGDDEGVLVNCFSFSH